MVEKVLSHIQVSEGQNIQNTQKWSIPLDLCLLARMTIQPLSFNKPAQHGRWIGVERYLFYFKAIRCQFTGILRKTYANHLMASWEIPIRARKSHSRIYSWLPLVIHAGANTHYIHTTPLKVFRKHTYTFPPPTLFPLAPDCGGGWLTRCHAEFTCLTSDWMLRLARAQ